MAEIFEKAESRSGTHAVDMSSERTLLYGVTGTYDEAEVVALIQGEVPAFYDGLIIQHYTKKTDGAGNWDIEAKYGTKDPQAPSFSFDTTGGTVKKTQSIKTMRRYVPAGEDKVDFKGCVNVDQKGHPQGTEITIPHFAFQITRYIHGPIDGVYARALYTLAGKVNSSHVAFSIRGMLYEFRAGELQFKGSRGSWRGNEDAEIVMHFEGSLNEGQDFFDESQGQSPGDGLPIVEDPDSTAGIDIGDVTGVAKKGWEYLWVKYEDGEDAGVDLIVPKVRQVNIEAMLKEADLNILFTCIASESTGDIEDLDDGEDDL